MKKSLVVVMALAALVCGSIALAQTTISAPSPADVAAFRRWKEI